jgi:hypothetical protein
VRAESPKLGGLLSEAPLAEELPEGELLTAAPRVSIDETRVGCEHCSGQGHAKLPVLLSPPGDEEAGASLTQMPAVPHWSEEMAACPGVANDGVREFDFLNPRQRSRVVFLDRADADAQRHELAHDSKNETRSPWSTQIKGPNPRIALPSNAAIEPLSMSPLPQRPVAPSGTMYLWSTSSETRAPQGHSTVGTSAGVVLTRPPGAYSIDWVGFAVTAPIQWR